MVHKVLGEISFAFFLALSEVNATLGEHQFGGVEDIRSMLEFRILPSRNRIDNPYLRQDDVKSEERNSKRNKQNDGHILIMLPRGESSKATNLSDKKSTIPLAKSTAVFNKYMYNGDHTQEIFWKQLFCNTL